MKKFILFILIISGIVFAAFYVSENYSGTGKSEGGKTVFIVKKNGQVMQGFLFHLIRESI